MTDDHLSWNRSQQGSTVNLWLVLLLIGMTVALGWQAWMQNQPLSAAPGNYVPRNVTPKGELASSEEQTIRVFRQTSPSVVFIRTKGFERFLFGGGQEKELSSGTGFVWDDQGHIVTNLHVISDTLRSNNTALEVQFADKTVVDAEVIGAVQQHDIAILRVAASGDRLAPIPLGTSDDLQVGQKVLAIGNPFGFDQTLSTGVIGGLNRSVAAEGNERSLDGLIQTDAAINPGNSGGPLLDSSGRMIGVNTAIVSPTGAYSGLGFAVPVQNVIASVEMVLEESNGNRPPQLGIYLLDPSFVEQLGVPAEISSRGLFINQVLPNGAAAGTDLQETRRRGYRVLLGDQITAIDEHPLKSVEDLRDVLAKYSPGDVVTLSVYRGNQMGTVQITLEAPKLIFE